MLLNTVVRERERERQTDMQTDGLTDRKKDGIKGKQTDIRRTRLSWIMWIVSIRFSCSNQHC